MKLLFLDSREPTAKITITPIFIDAATARERAEMQFPKIDTSGGLFGNIMQPFLSFITPEDQRQYKIEKAVYEAEIKAICKINFYLKNKGRRVANDISIFMDFPEEITPLEELPEPPDEPGLIPAMTRLSSATIQGVVTGPWVNEDDPHQIRYHSTSLKSDLSQKLLPIFLKPENKEAQYRVLYHLVSVDSDKQDGELIIIVKPKSIL